MPLCSVCLLALLWWMAGSGGGRAGGGEAGGDPPFPQTFFPPFCGLQNLSTSKDRTKSAVCSSILKIFAIICTEDLVQYVAKYERN